MSGQAPVLELKDVHASYDGAQVLSGVNLSVGVGETVGLIGRNGAGKSTTLHSVFGVPKVRGTIQIDSAPLKGRRLYEPAAHGVALVPQGRRILSNLSVRENLLLGEASGRAGSWSLERVLELFPNLARAESRSGAHLSGGEQQMVAIGRALLSNPRLLLLDEPTEGLAPVVIDELVVVLKRIQEAGVALLLVEQHILLVQKLASRFVALGNGTVVASGPVGDLQSREVQELIAL